ncbi:MAG TPA: hypothetical protein VL172_07770 [Kofleriaceae bacterium]|nr:hypothetical protein [Kofleriaceae bacterium]
MRSALLLLVLLGCGGGQPGIAPPPPYTPVNSPQAETECPTERDAAQQAREDWLERGESVRDRAAEAVFAQAECERARFDARAIPADREERMMTTLRETRLHYQTVANLYEEVTKYQALRWTVGARTRLGALNAAFADKLRTVGAPTDVTVVVDRVNFVSDLGSFAEDYDRQAAISHAAALETAALVPALVDSDAKVSGWVRASCDALTYLDPTARASSALCK